MPRFRVVRRELVEFYLEAEDEHDAEALSNDSDEWGVIDTQVVSVEEQDEDLLAVAGRMYDPERHDPDSVFFDDSYVGPSELELGGGCNRCGAPDDCYCNG